MLSCTPVACAASVRPPSSAYLRPCADDDTRPIVSRPICDMPSMTHTVPLKRAWYAAPQYGERTSSAPLGIGVSDAAQMEKPAVSSYASLCVLRACCSDACSTFLA